MPNLIDFIIICAFLYFIHKGWKKGFLKTLLGPISLIIGFFVGYGYYQKNQDLVTGLALCIISPFIINILASLILSLWRKAINSEIPPSVKSRLSGSIFSLLWGGCYLVMLLLLFAFFPLKLGWFEKIQDKVLSSWSYSLIRAKIGDKMPNGIMDVKQVTNILQDPEKFEELESSQEFQAVKDDPLLKDLLSDEEIAGLIQNKDYKALLSNPKMQAVFQDKELLGKLFALNKKIAEQEGQEDPAPTP